MLTKLKQSLQLHINKQKEISKQFKNRGEGGHRIKTHQQDFIGGTGKVIQFKSKGGYELRKRSIGG